MAHATTFDSNSMTTNYEGYSTSPTAFPTGTAPTYNVNPGTAWTAAVGSSSWISYNPGTAPGSVPFVGSANGYYYYNTSFVNGTATTTGSITVMADDTVSVYLNGITDEIVTAYNGVNYQHCAAGTPNCITPLTVSFGGLVAGTNTLTFVVHQAANAYTGLDYEGTTVTPEPSTFVLLGSGLIGAAGAIRRRMRA